MSDSKPTLTVDEQQRVRREKAKILKEELGINPWALGASRTLKPGEFAQFAERSEEDLAEERHCTAARIVALRSFGKAMFVRLQDVSGNVQAYLRKDVLGEDFRIAKKLDLGDHIEVSGPLFFTKTGELTIQVESFRLLTKALRPLPEKYHGVTDVEIRYRKRYLDLIANEESRVRFLQRSRLISFVRNFLENKGFLEVETPMMHTLVSGAAAKPFETFHNALQMPLSLRIAPELHLKRLLVGGFDRVFELNRNFRNEGISVQHNPEFTMVEFYMAYGQVQELIDMTRELLAEAARLIAGDIVVEYQGTKIDFGHARVVSAQSLLEENFSVPEEAWSDAGAAVCFCYGQGVDATVLLQRLLESFAPTDLWKILTAVGISDHEYADVHLALAEVEKRVDRKREMLIEVAGAVSKIVVPGSRDPRVLAHGIMHLLFEEKIEALLIQPTFVTDFPLYVSPLARRKEDKDQKHLVDRFELFIMGREIANGFNELNDPDDQKERFVFQTRARDHGDDEAMDYDADYIEALETGMPPAAGEGIGMDRLIMLLTDAPSIRDVILFPTLKKRQDD